MSEATPEPGSAGPAAGPQDPIYTLGLGNATVLRLSAYGVLLCFLAAGVFSALTPSPSTGPASVGWVQPALYVVIYIVTVIAHELVHGLGFRAFGGSPRYGGGVKFGLPYFYATSPGDAFPLRRMLVIGLAPLVALSTLSLVAAMLVPAWAGYCAVVFIGNTAGAVGDVWMMSRLVRFLPAKDATVVDLPEGMAVHSLEAGAAGIAAGLTALDSRPPGFAVHWIGAALFVVALGGLAALIGPAFTDSLLIGPAQLPLVEYTRSAQGITWTFNVAPPIVAGLGFAIAAHLISRRAARQSSAEEAA